MRIIVMSDSHGNYPLALKVCDRVEPVEVVIHLGDGCGDVEVLERVLDCNVISLAGNCDLGSPAPRELLWECGGKRFLLLHGDNFNVKSGLHRLEQYALQVRADAVLFGHTHIATCVSLSGVLFVNPGTLMKSALFNSIAILDVTQEGIEACILDVR